MTTRLAELREKMRAEVSPTHWALTDAECEAMLRELCKRVRDATAQELTRAPWEYEMAKHGKADFIPGIDGEGGEDGK